MLKTHKYYIEIFLLLADVAVLDCFSLLCSISETVCVVQNWYDESDMLCMRQKSCAKTMHAKVLQIVLSINLHTLGWRVS